MESNDKPLLCKDCKHSFQTWYDLIMFNNPRYTLRCRLSYKAAEDEVNLVTEPKRKAAHYETCSMARMHFVSKDNDTNCGQAGRWWQPKHKQDLFKLIRHASR